MSAPFAYRGGRRQPLGATPVSGGVNFSLFSRHATTVSLLLYAQADDAEPLQIILLDPKLNRTFFFWHVLVEGELGGLYYAWRVDGPTDAEHTGMRFDASRELLDPWARIVSDTAWNRAVAVQGGRASIRGRIAESDDYDWQGDVPVGTPIEDAIIYEMHVGGFTRHASAGVDSPGTFRGIVEKIPYLSSLGVTHVELMPVFAFDVEDVPAPVAALELTNYWGYSPYAFFALHPSYCNGRGDGGRREFRDMVKALHAAGIGVILDVVLNHTAEGGESGPTISFKGLFNESFYHLDPKHKQRYRDFTGCGNTINCNEPFVAHFLQQCLEFWAVDMHVDGFRFDLASVLTRDQQGEPTPDAPVVWQLEFADKLADRWLIAEPWDAGGLYQVGDFPGFRWTEWNGRYRDSVRRFLRGDPGVLGDVATRIAGSSDLYAPGGRMPTSGVNFFACHDGFTLYDLLSYDSKQNERNGEGNRDGLDENYSWNSGAEGDRADAEVERLREQRAKNFVAVLMLSQGVPMLLAGDEVLRTQRGNNNAWCQDNEISWFDWSLLESRSDMLRFTRQMIALRKQHPTLRRAHFLTESPTAGGVPEIRWYGDDDGAPDWRDPEVRVLCFTLAARIPEEPPLHAMLNMSEQACELPLPVLGGRRWHRLVDTSRAAPEDIVTGDRAPPAEARYRLPPQAVAVFEARQAGESTTAPSGGSVTAIESA